MRRIWDKSRPPTGPFTLNKDCYQAQGMIAWWPFGASAPAHVPDLCGTNHLTSTIPGTLTAGSYGEPCISLVSASTQFLQIAKAVTTIPVSMGCWFNTNNSGINEALMSIGASANDTNYLLMQIRGDLAGKPLRAVSQDGTNAPVADSAIAITANVWQHGMAAFESTSKRYAWLNGANKGSETATTSTPAGLNLTGIGRLSRLTAGVYFSGNIGETAIWNKLVPDDLPARLNDPALRFELWYPLRSRKWFTAPVIPPGGFTPVFRKTLSGVGTRVGARQVQG